MPSVRLFQSGLELGSLAEMTYVDHGPVDDSLVAAFPAGVRLSGSMAIEQQGSPGVGVIFAEQDQVRAGWLFSTNTGTIEPVYSLMLRVLVGAEVCQLGWVFANDYSGVHNLNWIEPDGTQTALAAADAVRFGWNTQYKTVAMGVTARAGDPGHFSLYLNGERLLNVDTPAFDKVVGIKWGETGVGFTGMYAYNYFDDLYVDGLGLADADACPPTLRFGWKRPVADSSVQWSHIGADDNYNEIDEAVTTLTDYVYTATGDDQDLYTVDDFTEPRNHYVTAVIPTAVARKGTVTAFDERLRFAVTNGGPVLTYGNHALTLGFRTFWTRLTLDPDGNDWQAGRVNTVDLGFKYFQL